LSSHRTEGPGLARILNQRDVILVQEETGRLKVIQVAQFLALEI
jgi:hypothetical protein